MYYMQLFAKLMQNGRYRTLIAVCRRVVANPPPTPAAYKQAGSIEEYAQMWLVRSYEQLKDDDAMLREGEKFMAKYPGSNQFQVIQMLLNAAIDRKRDREAGVNEARAEIAHLPGNQQYDPCKTGPIYKNHKQNNDALRDLETCMRLGNKVQIPWLTPFLLVWVNYDLHHFKESRKWIDYLRVNAPEQYRNVRHLETMMPREE
jgi:hypothetical protein